MPQLCMQSCMEGSLFATTSHKLASQPQTRKLQSVTSKERIADITAVIRLQLIHAPNSGLPMTLQYTDNRMSKCNYLAQSIQLQTTFTDTDANLAAIKT